jgi:hypothetical protein
MSKILDSICRNLPLFISLSPPFLLPPIWSIGHVRNALFHFSFLILRQSVRLLGWGMSPSQGRYLYKHRINTDRHPCLERDSNPRFQCSRGRRRFMPVTARPLWSAVIHKPVGNSHNLQNFFSVRFGYTGYDVPLFMEWMHFTNKNAY